MYDLLPVFNIVYPKDPTLKRVTLRLKDGSPLVMSLLKNFSTNSIPDVAKSSTWYNAFGNFEDSNRDDQTFGRDMSWSLLHCKEHIDSVLCNDVEYQLHAFKKEEQGGDPLYFIISMEEIVTLNEQSLSALESTVKIYNIATDRKDNLFACINLLCAITRLIVAMRADDSIRNALPDLFVVDIIKVLQTTSVQPFTDKMKQFNDNIEFKWFNTNGGAFFNTPAILDYVYSFAHRVHTCIPRCLILALGKMHYYQNPSPALTFTGRIDAGPVSKKGATNIDVPRHLIKQELINTN